MTVSQVLELKNTLVAGRVTAPKDVHVTVPRTCGRATLQGKGGSADEVVLRMLTRGDGAGLPGWALANPGVLVRGGRRVEVRKGAVVTQVRRD